MDRKFLLTVLILVGLVLGTIVGQFYHDPNWHAGLPEAKHANAGFLALMDFIGSTIFMGLLKMLIIPLVAASVIVGVTSVGDFGKLGRLGGWTVLYYVLTMFAAGTLGLVLVNALEPGASIAESQLAQAQGALDSGPVNKEMVVERAAGGVLGVFDNLVRLMIPQNLFRAMAEGKTLSIIVFSLFFGVTVTLVGEKGRIIAQFVEAVFTVLMRMVEVVLWIAPVGVFALLAWTVARIGLGVFGESIGFYIITCMIGLAIHGLIVLPTILYLFTRANPFLYMHQMRQAIMTAIATDSSSATLPVTIECATENGGVSKRAAGLVLPLGSTVNMDGTALYEAVAVVFMAQAFGIPLDLTQMILIAFTATLAAVGAAGIPSAGLVTMVIVVEAVNSSLLAANPAAATIPLAGIGLIVGVDRIVDMVRTAVNVWGDAVGAKIISGLDDASEAS